MAELIDKDELIQIIDTASDDLSERLKAVFIDIVAELPTVTEAEIRNKAIDEFAEKCFRELPKRYYCLDALDITEIAEQLKEE